MTGGTGVLGSVAVRDLLAAGHSVHVAARNADGAGDGTTKTAISLFDRPTLAAALTGVDAVLHLATRIPTDTRAVDPTAWRDNDELRAHATAALVDAALAVGVTTFVYPSVCFVYADGGDGWLRAGAPIASAEVLESTLHAEREVARFAARGDTRGVVLRLGGLYGPSSTVTRVGLAAATRGMRPFAGPDGAYTPTLWESDAGTALVAALDAPSGVYDVVDDEPLPRALVNSYFFAAVDQRQQSAAAGSEDLRATALAFVLRSHRISNTAFRQTTGWMPTMASVADATSALARIADDVL